MKLHRLILIVAASTVVAAVLGCGLPSRENEDAGHRLDPASTANTPDPCALLTKDEVAQVRGGVFLPGRETRGNQNGERVCQFDKKDSAVLTSIAVYPGDHAKFDDEFAAVKANEPTLQRIPGIGEDAFQSLGVFYVLKGRFIAVLVLLGTEPLEEREAMLRKLAAMAVNRMP
jgi:hypothetical protein